MPRHVRCTATEPTPSPAAFVLPAPPRVPLIPSALLARHACLIPGDTRWRAAQRLRQSLWREAQGLPAGLYRPGGDRTATPVLLGSLLAPADAARGRNFVSPAVHSLVRRSLVFREEGACVNVERLFRNALSSEPLVYNMFGPLALDLDLATRVWQALLPGFVHRVTGLRVETAPSRDRQDPRFLTDGTAFDCALSLITPDGEPATLFVEVKLSESGGPASAHRLRYDEASRELALHRDPNARVLRSVACEQLFRLHMLSQLCVRHGLTPRAHLVVLSPSGNSSVALATHRYAAELVDPAGTNPETVGFTPFTLEAFVAALASAGATAQAAYLAERYLDLTPVLDVVLADLGTDADPGPEAGPPAPPPPAGPVLALPPPSSEREDAGSEAVSDTGRLDPTQPTPRPARRRSSIAVTAAARTKRPRSTPAARKNHRKVAAAAAAGPATAAGDR
ncbi:PGN_0703 family putative restriction endonuclease [Methylobacterium radiotolerans]|uniref:PGN_0703 family putative restriction endonuclease n=1 Tax=Methylobacterium radiotolerans TaxID=31998 RepID=UPI0015F6D631|nr:hypothetical protein [Methylobacterium radiotolerans]